MSGLVWRTITPSTAPAFMYKGRELSVAFCDGMRFAIYEVRSYDADGNADREYVVRDAETVTLDEVRAGKQPQIIGRTSDITKLEAWIARGCPTA